MNDVKRIDDNFHSWPLRIYFEDTDVGGIVYHSRYLNFCERARGEILREMGIPSSRMMAEYHCGFAIRHVEMDFKRPAHLDEEIVVESHVAQIKGASMTIAHTIKRDDEILVEVIIVLVCMGQGERAVRIPDAVRDAINSRI